MRPKRTPGAPGCAQAQENGARDAHRPADASPGRYGTTSHIPNGRARSTARSTARSSAGGYDRGARRRTAAQRRSRGA